MPTLVTVEEAAEAVAIEAVAVMRNQGYRVWWRRLPRRGPARGETVANAAAYAMAVNDDEWEFALELVYDEGGLDDLVPEGFDEFTVFMGGSKGVVDELRRGAAKWIAVPETDRSRREVRNEQEQLLEFVTRLPADTAAEDADWLNRPGHYLRCSECSGEEEEYTEVVAVDDPEQECRCGALSRTPDGRTSPPDRNRYFTAVYRLAE